MGVYMKPKRKRCYFKVLAHGVFNKQWAGKLINWRVKWAKTKTNLYPHMSNINKPISTLGPNFFRHQWKSIEVYKHKGQESSLLINVGLKEMTKCLEHTYTNALPLPIKYIHIYVKAFELLEFNLYYISHSTPLELKFEILKCGIILINYSLPMV